MKKDFNPNYRILYIRLRIYPDSENEYIIQECPCELKDRIFILNDEHIKKKDLLIVKNGRIDDLYWLSFYTYCEIEDEELAKELLKDEIIKYFEKLEEKFNDLKSSMIKFVKNPELIKEIRKERI